MVLRKIHIIPIFDEERIIGYELDPNYVVLPLGTGAFWMGSVFFLEEKVGVSVEEWNLVISDADGLSLKRNFVLKSMGSVKVRNGNGAIIFVPPGQTLRFRAPVAVEMAESVMIPEVIEGANIPRSEVTASELESCEEIL